MNSPTAESEKPGELRRRQFSTRAILQFLKAAN